MQEIPKIIWMVWFQGEDDMPAIVKECVASWRYLNPTWEVRLLSSETIHTYVDARHYLHMKHLPIQHQSDMIRLLLLKTYGGVWADASLFCARPLNEWIDTVTPEGFFAFSRPRNDKMISNWFLVATKDNPVIDALLQAMRSYWEKGFLVPQRLQRLYHKCDHLFYLLGLVWFVKATMSLVRYVGLFPYFCFHYMFERLYRTDRTVRRIWNKTPTIAADGPHQLTFHGLTNPPDQTLLNLIQQQSIPVHKLSWRLDIQDATMQKSVVAQLISYTKQRYTYTVLN